MVLSIGYALAAMTVMSEYRESIVMLDPIELMPLPTKYSEPQIDTDVVRI